MFSVETPLEIDFYFSLYVALGKTPTTLSGVRCVFTSI
ncbi:hypothetical protein Y026_3085 [Burkholderia pseudomallei TSV28]|nr:hypothetical protein Y026_3085 [Burkholderia pseudomallei TSV28]